MMSLYDEVYGTQTTGKAQNGATKRYSHADVQQFIDEEADRQGVDRTLARAVAYHESGFDPYIEGDNGASIGPFQLQKKAAIDAGIKPDDRYDPRLNVRAGVTYLKQKLDQSKGNVDEALSRYNRGTPDYRGIGDPNYIQRVKRYLGPQSAEAATPRTQETAAPEPDLYEQIYGPRQKQQGERGLTGNYEPGEVDPDKGLVINIEKGPGLGFDRPQVLPVGLTQLNPDMDDDEILERLGYDPELVKKSKLYRPGNMKAHVTDPTSAWGVIADSPIGGIARGARDPLDALIQMGARGLEKTGLLNQSDVAYLDAITKIGEADYQQNWRKGRKVDPETGEAGMFNDPARLAGSAAIVPIPAGKATTLARTALRAGGVGAVQGALQPNLSTSPTPGSADDSFWSNKAAQAATGAVFGSTIGTGLEKGVLPVATKAIRSRLGSHYVDASPHAQRMADIAERHNIRITAGQATQSKGVQTVESVLRAIPGTGGTAQTLGQQADVMQEAPRVVDRALDVMRRTGWRNLGQVRAAAARGGPRAEDARIILEEISNAGDDWGRIIQASGKLSLFQDRLRATQLYDRVEQLAQPLGNMSPNRTIAAIDLALDDVNDQVALTPEVRRQVQQNLQRIRDEITPQMQSQPVPPRVNSITGTPVPQPPIQSTQLPDTSYSRMRRLDSHLGGVKRDAVDPTTAHYLGQVRSALRTDMDDFAQKSGVPELVQAHRDAGRFYRERVVKYREGQLANAVKKDLPDEIYGKFVKQGADRARYFYEGLDPKGQSAVRYGMIEEAFQEATKKDPGIFHPGRFAESMQRIQEARGVFFRGRERREIQNFTDLMRHIRAAGDIAERGAQGQRILTSIALGGGGYFNPLFVAKVLGIGQGLRALFMTERGRNFLLTSGRLQPGSPRWLREANRFAHYVTRGTGAAVAQGQRGEVPQVSEDEHAASR